MGPYIAINTMLVGFFAFAGLHYFCLWLLSRRELVLILFAALCVLIGSGNASLVALALANEPGEAQRALLIRTDCNALGLVVNVWVLALVTGVRPRWFLIGVTIFFLVVAAVNTLVSPVNAAVIGIDRVPLWWGEEISIPRRMPSGWWASPIYAAAIAIHAFGLYAGLRLWRTDRVGGIFVTVASAVIVVTIVTSGTIDIWRWAAPYFGNIPWSLCVALISLQVSREYRRRGVRLTVSENRFRAIFDQTFQFTSLLETDGTLVEANRTALEFAGIREIDAIGRPFWETRWWTHSPGLQNRLREATREAAAGKIVRFEASHPGPDGKLAYVDFSLKPVRDEHGAIALLISEARDITERMRAEVALRESHQFNAQIIASAQEGLIVIDRAQRYLLWNPRMEEITGLPAQEVLGKRPLELFPFLREAGVIDLLDRALAGETVTSKDFPYAVPGTDLKGWSMQVMGPIRNSLGEITGALVSVFDITARVEAEEMIRQILVGIAPTAGRDFFLALANHLSRACQVDYAFVGTLDPQDANVVKNIATSHRGETIDNLTYRLEKTPCENVVSKGLCYYPTGIQQAFPEDADLVQLGIDSYMGIPLKSSGDQPLGLIVLLHSRPMAQPHQAETILRVVAARAAAELERDRAETARRETESRHRAILESSLDSVIIMNAAGLIVEFNSAAEALFGYRREFLIGKSLAEHLIPPDLRDAHRHSLQRFLTTGEGRVVGTRVEMPAMRADGTLVRVELAIAPIPGATPLLFSGIVRDITERLELEEQLRQSQKMLAIGQLAGGVAHDFNNLLTVIIGYSDVLMELQQINGPLRESVAVIRDAGERAALLTRQLLLFSRKAMLAPKIIDLNDVLQNTGELLRRVIGEDITFTSVADPALHPIKADPSQIEQIVMNLSLNARDAMPGGGRLTLQTSNVTLGDDYCMLRPDARPGNYVLAAMTDTGCGMTPAVKARIFEPFFTTKRAGQGTGLGLATVYGIVKQSGGHIAVYSEVGLGTTFRLYFPAAEERAPAPICDSSAAPVRHGSETVLLVDDHDGVRSLAEQVLRSHGYTVLIASEGNEALRIANAETRPIDLLVTDVVMPGMSGRELSGALQARRPNMKVLYISGYTDDAVVRHGLLNADVAFLQKPFTPQSLAAKVAHTLAGKQPGTIGSKP